MQIKTTVRYHFIPVRMAIKEKQKQKVTSVGEGVEKLEPLYIACSAAAVENSMTIPQKIKHRITI